LQNHSQKNISIDRFTDQFPLWLAAADLSISMAGYNTCMNLVQAGIPALVYPFKQNREQRLRSERLGKKAPINILEDVDLTPPKFSEIIRRQLENCRFSTSIRLDGAEESVRQISTWQAETSLHD
jgi:predicted glycosyltransferase